MIDQTVPVDKLRALLDGEGSAEDKIQAIYDDLLPPVLPDPMFLAKATHPQYGEGTVISHFPNGEGCVRFVVPAEETGDGTWTLFLNPHILTFHTPETPETPTVLTTEEDYENAPTGTIVVAGSYSLPWVKSHLGFWLFCGEGVGKTNSVMASATRRVLRWGETLLVPHSLT